MNKFLELIKSQAHVPLIIEWNTITKVQKLEEGEYVQIWEIHHSESQKNYTMKLIIVSPKDDEDKFKAISQEISFLHSSDLPQAHSLFGITVHEIDNTCQIGIILPLECTFHFVDFLKKQNIENKKEKLITNFMLEYQKAITVHKFIKGFSPLHFAVIQNSKEIGEILISNGADINAKNIILFLINSI